ncbi:peptidyl-prolyl cis-trans isomerase FKBP43-like [Oryza brachyantha]|uniref:peptidyl-prolyl cis-trans isomerase FKBP43-like n=1 Tax=Oryza brachyantha TaxID=4533 RepID=UPI001ADD36F1|nr:peptidyl-prolyl cis-trans isomerase FKBP43-like [Oryza brachyantha]
MVYYFQATVGSFHHSGWVLVECKIGDQELVKIGAVNAETAPVCHLELEFEEDKDVVLSVLGQNSVFSGLGQNSVHLSGYYICSDNGDHGEDSKEFKSDSIDGEASLGLERTLGGNVLQTSSQEENAPLTDEDNNATQNIIQHTVPPILILNDNADAKNSDEKQSDEAKLSENVHAELHPEHTVILDNGMTMEDLTKGNAGAKTAINGRKVYVKYVCQLSNGDPVDPTGQSSTCKFILGAGEVISGWDLGIKGMHVGGKRRLCIPPHLGYGDARRGNIPPNSWLIYDIELLKVKRHKTTRKQKRARRAAPQASTTAS